MNEAIAIQRQSAHYCQNIKSFHLSYSMTLAYYAALSMSTSTLFHLRGCNFFLLLLLLLHAI